MKGKHFITIEKIKREIESGAVSDTKKCVSEMFWIGIYVGIRVLYMRIDYFEGDQKVIVK